MPRVIVRSLATNQVRPAADGTYLAKTKRPPTPTTHQRRLFPLTIAPSTHTQVSIRRGAHAEARGAAGYSLALLAKGGEEELYVGDHLQVRVCVCVWPWLGLAVRTIGRSGRLFGVD